MATPENTMLNRLKKKLEDDLGIMIEKTNNVFRRGRPDWDVFGPQRRMLFVEGKHWPKSTAKGQSEGSLYVWDNKYSPMQRKWASEHAAMGHACYCLCGFKSPDNYLFFQVDKNGPINGYKSPVLDYEQIRHIFYGLLVHE